MPVMSGPYLRPCRRRPMGYISSYDIETRGPEPVAICLYGPAPGRDEIDNSLPMIGGIVKTKLNKFYLGAQHIANDYGSGRNNSHTHATLDAAVREAKLRVEGGEEIVTIVKIVAVVKRKESPVVVEMVK